MATVQPIVIESDIEADRRRLWSEIVITGMKNGHGRSHCVDTADYALQEFDKRFPISKVDVFLPLDKDQE